MRNLILGLLMLLIIWLLRIQGAHNNDMANLKIENEILRENIKISTNSINELSLEVEYLKKDKQFIKYAIDDLAIYKYDEKNALELASYIYIYATEWEINPYEFYAFLARESSFNQSAKHAPVKVTKNKKTFITRAIGMSAIIYEYWDEALIEAKIIANKDDLLDLRKNIRSGAFIFSHLKKLPKLKPEISEWQNVRMRYLGAYNLADIEAISRVINRLQSRID